MEQINNKYAYYASFPSQTLLAAKEVLKSIPAFYNQVYFSSKYANALWNGDCEDMFSNVTLLAEESNVAKLRAMIKSNFLYLADWDSLRFTEGEDYGFSFIVGNVKFILLCYRETSQGYEIKSYDVDTGDCYNTQISVDKKYFLDTSIKENGEIVRICDFNLEYINNSNSTKHRAQKKAEPEMLVYKNKNGYALANLYLILGLACVVTVWLSYAFIRFRIG